MQRAEGEKPWPNTTKSNKVGKFTWRKKWNIKRGKNGGIKFRGGGSQVLISKPTFSNETF